MSDIINSEPSSEKNDVFAIFKRISRRRPTVTEQCELCSVGLAEPHPHLLDPKTRQVLCACDACAMVFCGQEGARYLRIPRQVRQLSSFQMTDLQWEGLMLPINLAFFYREAASGKVRALYPSPAGAMESLLSLESWDEIVLQNPVLQKMESDVEALLVNRVGAEAEYFKVPIDECYRLVGLIRKNWKGLSGGTEVWTQIQSFFSALKGQGVGSRDHAREEAVNA
ncbi:MAG: DUF5947 family protein [Acidobacteriota bacterium]|nr:DUF5947 family protein [Acidobacteriota bacterium]